MAWLIDDYDCPAWLVDSHSTSTLHTRPKSISGTFEGRHWYTNGHGFMTLCGVCEASWAKGTVRGRAMFVMNVYFPLEQRSEYAHKLHVRLLIKKSQNVKFHHDTWRPNLVPRQQLLFTG